MRRATDPKYKRQKVKGGRDRAYTTVDGKRIYLGAWGTEESKQKFEALRAERREAGDQPAIDPRPGLTVIELAAAYRRYASAHYRDAGGAPVAKTINNLDQSLRIIKRLYGRTPVAEFGPRRLAIVRSEMIAQGWKRRTVNNRISAIRRMFKWGVSMELLRGEQFTALAALEGLRAGRSDAAESEPVAPAPERLIRGAREHVSRQVRALIDLQLFTGARPGELCPMRAADIDMSGNVWIYRPRRHKNAHRGQKREIMLGPKAQNVVRPFLIERPTDAPLFSPADAEAERRRAMHEARRTPVHHGNGPGTNKRVEPVLEPGEAYSTNSYRRAIERGCAKAFPHPIETIAPKERTAEQRKVLETELADWRRDHRFSPHQLRHNAATRIRAEFGIDVAGSVLGHALGSQVTEIYAEPVREKAYQAILKTG